jgi:hypothetical protein
VFHTRNLRLNALTTEPRSSSKYLEKRFHLKEDTALQHYKVQLVIAAYEIMAVFSKNYRNQFNTLCKQNTGLLSVKAGSMVTIDPNRVNV